jgi:hypothetical protein
MRVTIPSANAEEITLSPIIDLTEQTYDQLDLSIAGSSDLVDRPQDRERA